MVFNEDSRVKIPSILHLMQLGYEYLSLKNNEWDVNTNIFTEIFNKQIAAINPGLSESEIKRFYDEVSLSLENEDLGRAFYNKLIDQSAKKLIDFDNFEENNSFHVVTEGSVQ
ncbi:MAG: type I restriction endonuclease [Crocinitomicaceae bacterium]|nr:type I restriction endonuclease [Crocinitomicaceae bacterium]